MFEKDDIIIYKKCTNNNFTHGKKYTVRHVGVYVDVLSDNDDIFSFGIHSNMNNIKDNFTKLTVNRKQKLKTII